MSDQSENTWLTPDELESVYGIKKSTQAKLRMDGKIPYSKIGRMVRYQRGKIEAWLKAAEVVA